VNWRERSSAAHFARFPKIACHEHHDSPHSIYQPFADVFCWGEGMRIRIAIYSLGIVVFGVFAALSGSTLKSQAFDEKAGNYTVVLKTGEDASLISSEHKSDGVEVDHVTSDGVDSGYVATMSSTKANELLTDSRVAYVSLNGTMTVHHTWMENMQLTIDRQVSNIF
jgi:hypothetical protein